MVFLVDSLDYDEYAADHLKRYRREPKTYLSEEACIDRFRLVLTMYEP